MSASPSHYFRALADALPELVADLTLPPHSIIAIPAAYLPTIQAALELAASLDGRVPFAVAQMWGIVTTFDEYADIPVNVTEAKLALLGRVLRAALVPDEAKGAGE